MNKNILIIVGIIVLGAGGYFFFSNQSNSQPVSQTPSVNQIDTTTTSTPTPAASQGATNQPAPSQNPSTPTTPAPQAGTYTMAQVATHKDATSCYTAIRGNVYDLTSWIDQHPGGQRAILGLCGKDGTSAFEDQHGGQPRPENELDGFKIGTVAK